MSSKSETRTWINCKQCLEEILPGESPSSWARLNVGVTDTGFEVWCTRHDHVVARFDVAALKAMCDDCSKGKPHVH